MATRKDVTALRNSFMYPVMGGEMTRSSIREMPSTRVVVMELLTGTIDYRRVYRVTGGDLHQLRLSSGVVVGIGSP